MTIKVDYPAPRNDDKNCPQTTIIFPLPLLYIRLLKML